MQQDQAVRGHSGLKRLTVSAKLEFSFGGVVCGSLEAVDERGDGKRIGVAAESEYGPPNLSGNAMTISSKEQLALDFVQFSLDIVGIADPTGIADGMSGLMSLGQGRLLDAAISGVSMIPYIGDLAKTAKLPRYVASVKAAIKLAATDYKFANELRAAARVVRETLEKIPTSELPNSAVEQIADIQKQLDQFLGRRFYNPNPKHELSGAMGRRGTRLDMTSDQAYELLNERRFSVEVPGKKQVLAVKNGKIYVFQPDGAGGFHAYPSTGNEIAAKYPTAASRVAALLGTSVKRLTRMH